MASVPCSIEAHTPHRMGDSSARGPITPTQYAAEP